MIVCPHCANPVPGEGTRFCINCGGELSGGGTMALPSRAESGGGDAEPPFLIGFRASGEKTVYRLGADEISIGKSPHNRIILDDPTVSASHAIVHRRSDQSGQWFTILDLASRNGTYVNGESLSNRAHQLEHGDRIQIGQVLLTFRLPDTAETRTANLEQLPHPERPVAKPAPPARVGARVGERTITINLPREIQRAVAAGPDSGDRHRTGSRGLDPRLGATGSNSRRRGSTGTGRTRIGPVMFGAIMVGATLIGAALIIGLTLYLTRQTRLAPPATPPQTFSTSQTIAIVAEGTWLPVSTGLRGEIFEASGVTMRPGSNELILAGDRHADRLFRVTLDETGLPAREPVPFSVLNPAEPGGTFSDPEALTYGNGFFYLLCSQSDPVDTRQHRLLRFDLDPATHQTRGPVEAVDNLRDLLLNGIPEIATIGARPGSVGGLNAEGLAWDPNLERLLVGLRSPLIGDQAILVPLKMREPHGPFEAANLALASPAVTLLPLGGQGIRDLTYDPHLKSFLILSGPPENRPQGNFSLWEWNGRLDSRPNRLLVLEAEMRPEGILSLSVGEEDFLIITGDQGHYLKLGYREMPWR